MSAEWADIDLKKALWVIPAEKRKTRKTRPVAHVVPLTPEAVDLLERRRAAQPATCRWVFPAKRAAGFWRWGSADDEAVREKTGIRDLRAHDLRRTMATRIRGLGFSARDRRRGPRPQGEPSHADVSAVRPRQGEEGRPEGVGARAGSDRRWEEAINPTGPSFRTRRRRLTGLPSNRGLMRWARGADWLRHCTSAATVAERGQGEGRDNPVGIIVHVDDRRRRSRGRRHRDRGRRHRPHRRRRAHGRPRAARGRASGR